MFSSTFTFSTPTRSPSLSSSNTTRSTSRSVSPCSALPTSTFPQPTFSVTDLAACFQNSKLLRRDAQICYDPCDAYANTADDDASWEIPAVESIEPAIESVGGRSRTGRTTSTSQRALSPSSRRNQRQASTRMMCSSASHHRDIAALVKRMVERKDQCSITSSTTEPLESDGMILADDDDEGYDSGEMSLRRVVSSSEAIRRERIEYRRSSELRLSGGCVSKAVRFRRVEGRAKKV